MAEQQGGQAGGQTGGKGGPKVDPNQIGAVAAGMAAAAGMFQSAAIVGALIESGAIDPDKVAAWAEMFAEKQSAQLSPDVREAVAGHLKGFAQLIRSMPKAPPQTN